MKYVHIHVDNGYCGCDADEPFALPDEYTEEEINELAYDIAVENAETFAYVHFGWNEDYSAEDYEEYIANYVKMDWYYLTREEYLEDCENCGVDPETGE